MLAALASYGGLRFDVIAECASGACRLALGAARRRDYSVGGFYEGCICWNA